MTNHGVFALASKPKSLAFHIATLPDPRKARGQRHLLLDIMVIAVLATMSGVDEWSLDALARAASTGGGY